MLMISLEMPRFSSYLKNDPCAISSLEMMNWSLKAKQETNVTNLCLNPSNIVQFIPLAWLAVSVLSQCLSMRQIMRQRH